MSRGSRPGLFPPVKLQCDLRWCTKQNDMIVNLHLGQHSTLFQRFLQVCELLCFVNTFSTHMAKKHVCTHMLKTLCTLSLCVLNHWIWWSSDNDQNHSNNQYEHFFKGVPSRELIYPLPRHFESMIFLFPRWDMLVSWRVIFVLVSRWISKSWHIIPWQPFHLSWPGQIFLGR